MHCYTLVHCILRPAGRVFAFRFIWIGIKVPLRQSIIRSSASGDNAFSSWENYSSHEKDRSHGNGVALTSEHLGTAVADNFLVASLEMSLRTVPKPGTADHNRRKEEE
jgi:hypothetical protein